MNPLFVTKLKYLVQIVICAIFLYMFCNNSLLRPSPSSAQAKEYCIGTLLLLICYLNAFVLYPLFFQRNKTAIYLATSISSIVVTNLVEFTWLYPDIMSCIQNNLPPNEVHSYYRDCIFFASLRDIGLLSFTFLICDTNRYRNQNRQTEKILMKSESKIEVKDIKGNNLLLNYKQIRFCEQEQNATKIYGNGNSIYFRYGSLKSIQNIIGNSFFVQISRKILVARKQIRQYSDGQLWLLDEERPFEVSPAFQKQDGLLPSTPDTDCPMKKEQKKRGKRNISIKNNKKKTVYQLIIDNPGISAVGISEQTGFTQSTASRILKQLKDEGLIKYEGSKKTGGYSVVSS